MRAAWAGWGARLLQPLYGRGTKGRHVAFGADGFLSGLHSTAVLAQLVGLPSPCAPRRAARPRDLAPAALPLRFPRRFVIPLGMCLGAEVTWSQFFFNNLLPVTLGNTIAGVFMMAIAYSVSFGSLGKAFQPKTATA